MGTFCHLNLPSDLEKFELLLSAVLFLEKNFRGTLNQMDMSALDHNTSRREDDESQAKLVLVATPNGFPSSLFHTM